MRRKREKLKPKKKRKERNKRKEMLFLSLKGEQLSDRKLYSEPIAAAWLSKPPRKHSPLLARKMPKGLPVN